MTLILKATSKAKSLSDTASIEFLVTESNPKDLASFCLSNLNLLPDRAPEPKGLTLSSFLVAETLSKSLFIISYQDKR